MRPSLSANIRISFKIFNKLLEIFIFIQSIYWLHLACTASIFVGLRRKERPRNGSFCALPAQRCFPRYFLETVLTSVPQTIKFNHFSLRKRIPYHYECLSSNVSKWQMLVTSKCPNPTKSLYFCDNDESIFRRFFENFRKDFY